MVLLSSPSLSTVLNKTEALTLLGRGSCSTRHRALQYKTETLTVLGSGPYSTRQRALQYKTEGLAVQVEEFGFLPQFTTQITYPVSLKHYMYPFVQNGTTIVIVFEYSTEQNRGPYTTR